MAKTPSKKPKVREDANTTAFRTLQEALGEAERTPDPDAGKDPKAVAKGRLGGLLGGLSRAKLLTPAKRAEIAKKAANSRWNKGADKSKKAKSHRLVK
jgi:hypothetical protein